MGAITAWLASAAEWLEAYGPLGWWLAGISVFLFTLMTLMLLLLLMSFFRFKLVEAKAIKNWNERTSDINPLDNEFSKVRIRILDLVSPIDGCIDNKKFSDCEIIGPANIFFYGGGGIYGCVFSKLDLVLCKDDSEINNIIPISNFQFVNCRFHRVTFYLSPSTVDKMFLDENFNWVTLSPMEVDNLQRGARDS